MNIEKKDIQYIKTLLTATLSVDFLPYKDSTVMRRIEKRMTVLQLTEVSDYINCLKKEEKELRILGEDIFINVTDFFRDPHVFQKIKQRILPIIFSSEKRTMKFWVAGCATGEEAYSMAILVKEFCEENNYKHKIKIIATDIKEEAINKARQGIYTVKEILGVNRRRLRRFFDREGDKYRIKKHIRSEVIFAIHDITADPPFARVDLLSCRNLLIYLDKENQQKVLASLVFALNTEGFLVLGKSETAIDLSYDLKNISSVYKIYKRIKNTRTTRRLNFDISYQDSLLPILVPPSENEAGMKEHELVQSFQHIIHQKYAPAVVIIDEQFYVKHITHSAKKYIDTPEDYTKIYSLTALAPEAVTALVRAAISEIKKGKSVNVYPPLPVTYQGKVSQISIVVEALELESNGTFFYAISFEESRQNGKTSTDVAKRINLALQTQLADTEENLRKTIEKLENTNQNLLASNEELQSTNEEYISVNEELQTINSEYQDTIEELSVSNKDVDHLLQSTDIGTIFLDDKLHIRKFTNPIKDLINIDDIDLKRPFKNFTHNLKNINIYKEVKNVLNSNQAIEKEVISEDDIHYLMRATPYDVDEERRKGIVLSFINIQQLIEAEKALTESELLYRSVFNYANDGIVLVNENEQKVNNVNQRQLEMLGYTKEEYLNTTFRSVFSEIQSNGQTIEAKVRRYKKAKSEHEAVEWTLKRKDKTLIETEISTVNMPAPYEGYTLNIIRDITQKKQTQLEILASQKRFEAVFDTSPIGISVAGTKFNIIRVNKAFARMIGYTSKQLGQMAFSDITYHEDRKPNKKHLEELISGKKKTITFEKRYVKKNGRVFWAKLWVSILDDGSGEQLFLANIRDITKEKEAEKNLQDSELRYRLLFEKNIDAVLIYDFKNNKILSANKSACKLFDCSKKYLLEHSPIDFFPEFQENGEPSMQFFGKQMQNYVQTGEIRHFMQLQTKKQKPIEVEITAFPLDDSPNSEMVVQFRNITEQKAAQQALQKSEARFRSVYENSAEAILIKDLTQQKVTQFNSKFTEITGYTEEDFEKLSGADMTLEPQADGRSAYVHHEEHMQALKETGYCFVENWLLIHKDGHTVHTNMSLSKLYDDREDAIVLQFRDITEQYKAQQTIKESEQRFRSLFEYSADAVSIVDSTALQVIDCNKKAEEVYRVTKEEFLGKSPLEVSAEIQADGRQVGEHIFEHIAIVQKQGYHAVGDWIGKRADGTEFYSEFSLTCFPEPNEHLFIVQQRDISERLQAQKVIEESEQRFRSLFENSAIGISIFDIKKMIVLDCNQQFAALHGFSIEEFKKIRPKDVTAKIQADGRNTSTHLQEQIATVIKNGSLTVNNWLCKRKDGTIFNAEVTLNILNKNTPNIIFVHMRDVTEKLTARKALQGSEERFRTLFEYSADAVSVYDTKTLSLVDCNKKVLETFGLPRAEYIGQNPSKFSADIQPDGRTVDEHIREHIAVLQKQDHYFIENWLSIRADGTEFYSEFSLSLLPGNDRNYYLVQLRDVSQRRQAQQEIQEQKDYLNTIINLVPSMITAKDTEGNFVLANHAATTLYGVPIEKLIGKNRREFGFGFGVGKSLAGDEKVIQTGKLQQYNNAILNMANGEERIFQITKVPLKNDEGDIIQVVAVANDITELKQIERDLRESQARFQAVFENSYSIVAVTDEAGKLIEQNKPLRNDGNIYDMVGKPIWESRWFSHDKKVATQIKKDFKKSMKGKSIINQCTYLRTPDSIGYMSYSIKPIYLEEGGELLFILAESRDITDLMLAQKELGVKIDELNTKNEELKKYIDSNMQLENFAYITSHDLREPLRTISGFANLLEKRYVGKLDDTADEYLGYILTSTKNMNALIEDLLIFSRVHTGEHKVEKLSLDDLLFQVIRSLDRTIQETGAVVTYENIPKIINANETKMKQLFQNLIANAIKFRKPDTTPEVRITAKSKGKYWEFSIQDNGIGIDEEYFDKIFMIFKRLHTKDEYDGTGIGLSLCKKIVKQHGGEIHPESTSGEGTTFYFTIAK